MGHDSWGALGFGFGVALIIPTTTTTTTTKSTTVLVQGRSRNTYGVVSGKQGAPGIGHARTPLTDRT